MSNQTKMVSKYTHHLSDGLNWIIYDNNRQTNLENQRRQYEKISCGESDEEKEEREYMLSLYKEYSENMSDLYKKVSGHIAKQTKKTERMIMGINVDASVVIDKTKCEPEIYMIKPIVNNNMEDDMLTVYDGVSINEKINKMSKKEPTTSCNEFIDENSIEILAKRLGVELY